MNGIVKTGVYTYNDKEYNFNFYTDINALTKTTFVNSIVDVLVTEKHYHSVIKDVIFKYQLINVFTDVLAEDEIRDSLFVAEGADFDLNKIEEFVNNTTIVDIILANVREGLIEELVDAVDKDIEYKTGVHKNFIGKAIANFLGILENKIEGIDLNSLMVFADTFKNIPVDEISSEKLIDAYGKSDIFKKIREEADMRNEENIAKTTKIIDIKSATKDSDKKDNKKSATKANIDKNEVNED